MAKISTWSTTAASNNSSAPDGFPEGMNPSSVNNACREVMAAVRTQHEDAQWIDLGDTPTFATSTTFTITGDVTGQYDVGRRVKCTDSSTLYGEITASSYSNPNTTVTVALDSGSLSVSLSAVALGIVSGQNASIPKATTDILPLVDATYDLGSSSRQWVDGHFSNDVLVNTKSVVTSDTVVTGHTRAGNMQIVNGSTDATFGNFVVSSSVTENTMETVGPTGGGASNTWSAIDQLPSNATILLADVLIFTSPNSTNDAQVHFFATDGDQSESWDTNENRLAYLTVDTDDTSGTDTSMLTRVYIPLNSSRVFRCTWRDSAAASATVTLYYRGFMTD